MDFSLEKKQLIKLNTICKSNTEETTVLLSDLGIKNPSNTLRYFEKMIINNGQQQAPVFTSFEINDDTFFYSLSPLFCELASNSEKWVIDDFIKSPVGEPTQIYIVEQKTDQQNTKSKKFLFIVISILVFAVMTGIVLVGTDAKNTVTASEFIQSNIADITGVDEISIDEIESNGGGKYLVSVSFLDGANTVNNKFELKLGQFESETDHSFTILYSKKIDK